MVDVVLGKRNLLLLSLLMLLAWGSFEYFSAPVFWQRFAYMLIDADKGANSRVFQPTVSIGSAAESKLVVARPDQRTVSDEALAAAVDYAKSFDSYGLLVAHRGVIQLEWYGEAYNQQSLTQSQSMHKTLQALLIGAALHDGKIESLNTRLSEHLHEWRNDSRQHITVEHALRMSTGLTLLEPSFSPWSSTFRWLYSSDNATATLQQPQVEEAGQVFEYNDLNSQALGIYLSRATGVDYAQYLEEKLWTPMGGQIARIWLDQAQGQAMHACCLLATVRDWARIGIILSQRGVFAGRQLIPSDWIQQMTSRSALTPHYGFQLWLANNAQPNPRKTGYQRSEAFLDNGLYYLSGYGAQRVYVSEQFELVIVRLGPAAGYFPKINTDWDNAYLPNTIIRGIKD